MDRVLVVAALCISANAALAQSPTFRCLDAVGRSTYTNIKEETVGKKCSIVSREVSVVPADRVGVAPPSSAKPAAPQVQPPAPANRSADRRKILEEELNGEQKRLSEARQKLAEQQAIRTGDEKNYQRVLDRLKPYSEVVERHEKNVQQLQRELTTVK